MDPRNERRIFSQICDTSCSEASGAPPYVLAVARWHTTLGSCFTSRCRGGHICFSIPIPAFLFSYWQDVSPQTFLVSPKLLPNLDYTEGVTVHTVFNGPHMCLGGVGAENKEHDPRRWNINDFIEASKRKASTQSGKQPKRRK